MHSPVTRHRVANPSLRPSGVGVEKVPQRERAETPPRTPRPASCGHGGSTTRSATSRTRSPQPRRDCGGSASRSAPATFAPSAYARLRWSGPLRCRHGSTSPPSSTSCDARAQTMCGRSRSAARRGRLLQKVTDRDGGPPTHAEHQVSGPSGVAGLVSSPASISPGPLDEVHAASGLTSSGVTSPVRAHGRNQLVVQIVVLPSSPTMRIGDSYVRGYSMGSTTNDTEPRSSIRRSRTTMPSHGTTSKGSDSRLLLGLLAGTCPDVPRHVGDADPARPPGAWVPRPPLATV